MEYRVLKITTNIEEYPEAKEDTLANPDLVEYVEDEFELFIRCGSDFWNAGDFFYMTDIKGFIEVQ